MPNIMTDFEHLKTLDDLKIFERRRELLLRAPAGDISKITDEATLVELLAISRILRTRGKPPSVSGGKKITPTVGML